MRRLTSRSSVSDIAGENAAGISSDRLAEAADESRIRVGGALCQSERAVVRRLTFRLSLKK